MRHIKVLCHIKGQLCHYPVPVSRAPTPDTAAASCPSSADRGRLAEFSSASHLLTGDETISLTGHCAWGVLNGAWPKCPINVVTCGERREEAQGSAPPKNPSTYFFPQARDGQRRRKQAPQGRAQGPEGTRAGPM